MTTRHNNDVLNIMRVYSEGAQGCCTAHIEAPLYLSCYFCRSIEAYAIIFGRDITVGYAACHTCLIEVSSVLHIPYALRHEDRRN
jgi:hypothetical protein